MCLRIYAKRLLGVYGTTPTRIRHLERARTNVHARWRCLYNVVPAWRAGEPRRGGCTTKTHGPAQAHGQALCVRACPCDMGAVVGACVCCALGTVLAARFCLSPAACGPAVRLQGRGGRGGRRRAKRPGGEGGKKHSTPRHPAHLYAVRGWCPKRVGPRCSRLYAVRGWCGCGGPNG